MHTFQRNNDGWLLVNGQPLWTIQESVGQTPFFVYDRSLIQQRIRALKEILPDDLELAYSMKANPWEPVVHEIAKSISTFDVASAGEMKIALDAGIHPEKILFAGPGKSKAELRRAIAAGIVISVESVGEYERLSVEAQSLGLVAKVVIRVNPDFETNRVGMKMGGAARQFGVDANKVAGMMAGFTQQQLAFYGFHIYWGSQCLDFETINHAQQHTISLVERLSKEAPCSPKIINIGGGFGIPYFKGDEPLDLEPIADAMKEWMPKFTKDFPQTELVLELGRYIIGESGLYVSKVVDKKESYDKTFLVTDGGLHHQLAASGNFGQVIRRNFPIILGREQPGKQKETVDIVGCLCTPIDMLGQSVELSATDVDDLIIISQSGAYGRTASPNDFLSHPEPVEVLV